MHARARRPGTIAAAVAASLALGCAEQSEREAYEDVLASMSLAKVASFLERYEDGDFSERLLDELIRWCEREAEVPQACLEQLRSVVPPGHSRSAEIASAAVRSQNRGDLP